LAISASAQSAPSKKCSDEDRKPSRIPRSRPRVSTTGIAEPREPATRLSSLSQPEASPSSRTDAARWKEPWGVRSATLVHRHDHQRQQDGRNLVGRDRRGASPESPQHHCRYRTRVIPLSSRWRHSRRLRVEGAPNTRFGAVVAPELGRIRATCWSAMIEEWRLSQTSLSGRLTGRSSFRQMGRRRCSSDSEDYRA